MIKDNQQPCTWLARKFLFVSIGLNASIACIMGISWLAERLGMGSVASSFVAILLTSFVKTFYEQLVILNIPKMHLEPGNIFCSL